MTWKKWLKAYGQRLKERSTFHHFRLIGELTISRKYRVSFSSLSLKPLAISLVAFIHTDWRRAKLNYFIFLVFSQAQAFYRELISLASLHGNRINYRKNGQSPVIIELTGISEDAPRGQREYTMKSNNERRGELRHTTKIGEEAKFHIAPDEIASGICNNNYRENQEGIDRITIHEY